MSLRDDIQGIEELIEYIDTELPAFAETVLANDLQALVINRVIQDGENYKGQAFSTYSNNPVPAYKFWGKSRTQAAEKKVRDLSKKKERISYSDFRKLNNLKANRKNFEFTGEMFKKVGVLQTLKLPTGVRVIIGGTTSAAREKLQSNSEREGINILEASDAERQIAFDAAGQWMREQSNRILGQ